MACLFALPGSQAPITELMGLWHPIIISKLHPNYFIFPFYVVLPYTTFPVPFLFLPVSPTIFDLHRKNKMIERSTVLTFPLMRMTSLSIYRDSFIHSFTEYFLSADCVSNSSFKRCDHIRQKFLYLS